MAFDAIKQHVYNRGTPPDSFLEELIEWGKSAPEEIFAKNQFSDIYSSVRNTLGPWQGIGHRRAVLLEVLRVLAGFESSWKWNEGRDPNNDNPSPDTWEAGIYQVSANSMYFGSELRDLVEERLGSSSTTVFRKGMMENHELAIEYSARLLRRTTQHHGPVKRGEIHAWLRTDAVEEFQELLGNTIDIVRSPDPQDPLPTPNGRAEINALFGKPTGPDDDWEEENIIRVRPPQGWQLYYQGDTTLTPVSSIKLHRKLEDSFTNVLTDIWAYAKTRVSGNVTDDKIRRYLHDKRLDQYAGSHVYRVIAGTNRLSLHSYGIAIDWDANNNPSGSTSPTLPDWWYEIWKNHGWHDGRRFPTPDPMHVQYATGA